MRIKKINLVYLVLIAVFILGASAISRAQPRPIEMARSPQGSRATSAPASFNAKYEGGLFGYNERVEGTLKFDDANGRLVFFGKDQKERFGLPYDSMLVVYPQSKSVTSTAGNVIRNVPLPGAGLAGLMREKRRYLVVHYDDQDVDAKGVINFKLDNKQILDSVIDALGEKAKLARRGDAYYRPKAVKTNN